MVYTVRNNKDFGFAVYETLRINVALKSALYEKVKHEYIRIIFFFLKTNPNIAL